MFSGVFSDESHCPAPPSSSMVDLPHWRWLIAESADPGQMLSLCAQIFGAGHTLCK